MNKINQLFNQKSLTSILAVLFWIFLWEAFALLLSQPLFLPDPLSVGKTLVVLFSENRSWIILLYSFGRILLGFLFGTIVGILLGVLSSRSSFLRSFLSPALTFLRATPVASFIMLVWLILGANILPVAISTIMVFPLIYGSTLSGIFALSPELSEVCKLYRIPFGKRFRLYVLPAMMPHIAPAVITAFGLSFKAGISAEVLSHTEISVGNRIFLAKSDLAIPELFAWTTVIVVIAVLMEAVLRRLLRPYTKGRTENADLNA